MTSFNLSIAQTQRVVSAANNQIAEEASKAISRTNQVVKSAIDTFKQNAQNEVKKVVNIFWPLVIAIVVLGFFGIVFAVVDIIQKEALQLSDITGILVAIAGAIGLYLVWQSHKLNVAAIEDSSDKAKNHVEMSMSAASKEISSFTSNTSQNPGFANRSDPIFRVDNQQTQQSVESGYERMRLELVATLGYDVAISKPLIEYFVLSPSFTNIHTDFEVMTEIIWNGTQRQQEVMCLAFAAFGPFATYGGAGSND